MCVKQSVETTKVEQSDFRMPLSQVMRGGPQGGQARG